LRPVRRYWGRLLFDEQSKKSRNQVQEFWRP
jgi:hypothetical protein